VESQIVEDVVWREVGRQEMGFQMRNWRKRKRGKVRKSDASVSWESGDGDVREKRERWRCLKVSSGYVSRERCREERGKKMTRRGTNR